MMDEITLPWWLVLIVVVVFAFALIGGAAVIYMLTA
jgi:hypothetical protein